ncbi:HNH endonuclease signature motif containing protein [Sphingomonas sp. HITSZ_GF]|nr:HNH endonuclease signature motif containing protein [Sphingomonas sp. HITSZ_GF]
MTWLGCNARPLKPAPVFPVWYPNKYLVPDIPPKFGQRGPSQRQGGSAGSRDRSAAYNRLRLSLLRSEPLCRYCLARSGKVVPAVLVDHVVALSLGGTNDRDNLAPACHDCNAAKAVAEQRYIQRGYDLAFVHLDPELGEWIRLAARLA